MFKISSYEYIYLHALDVGDFLEEYTSNTRGSHEKLLDLRSQGRVDAPLLNELKELFDHRAEAVRLGSFTNPKDEGDVLRDRIEEACRDGGKRIFTHHFLAHLASTIFESPSSGLFHHGGVSITPTEAFLPRVGGQPMHYKGAKLRFFRNGVLGLELHFVYNNDRDRELAPIDAAEMIGDIRLLEEEFATKAAYQKFQEIYRTFCLDPGVPAFDWRKNWLTEEHFLRLGVRHRVLLLKSLVNRDTGDGFDLERDIDDTNALKDLAGILNRAKWHDRYWVSYLQEIREKFIAYQADEMFITDGNSSLILFPGYWTDSANKKQYIGNILAAANYLLSWEALRGYFDNFISEANDQALDLWSQEYSREKFRDYSLYLAKLRQVVGQFRDAVAVGSLVNHGFTARVLDQFIAERAMARGNDEMAIKLDHFSRNLESVASSTRSDGESRLTEFLQREATAWGKRQVWAALAALFLTSALGLLQFFDVKAADIKAFFLGKPELSRGPGVGVEKKDMLRNTIPSKN